MAQATEESEVVKALPVFAQVVSGHPKELHCTHCSYRWVSTLPRLPVSCPKCCDRRWNLPRTYTKIYAPDDRRNFRAVPGKRISHTLASLTAQLDLYRMSKERDLARLAVKKVGTLIQTGEIEQATDLLVKLDSQLDWNSSKYPPDPKRWDDIIEETETELERAKKSYLSKMSTGMKMIRRGRFAAS